VTLTKRFAGLTIGVAIIAAACAGGTSAGPSGDASAGTSPTPNAASPSAAPVAGTVTIDGSSTVYPITAAVAEDFQAANPDARVTVGFSGTGGGFKKFCVGETDINDASRPIKADDEGEGKACATNAVEYVELKVAIDGLTVVVNPANDWATCLTTDQLKAIYGPESPVDIRWSDVDPAWPAEEIVRFMPGADSGTFDYFTEVINGEVDASTQDATQSENDNELVTGVAGDKNAIGYFGYAYYVENTDKVRAAEIDGGTGCVAPTDATINDNSYAPLSRPLFIYPDTGKARENPALTAFVDFYLANASTLAADVGYVALPADQLTTETTEWETAIQ
jgi:phosphate transport system substrate-binding protein